MPMYYDESVLPLVKDEISKAGGTISHNDLVQRLQAAGRADAAQSLLPAAMAGLIVSKVEPQPVGPAVLKYSLPS